MILQRVISKEGNNYYIKSYLFRRILIKEIIIPINMDNNKIFQLILNI